MAYRCNTCAFTPCKSHFQFKKNPFFEKCPKTVFPPGMSLCEACFDANGHVGHDYIRFFSREGGACDCGNQDVIKESGNCPEHGDESKRPKYDMTDVCMAEYIITKLVVRMFLDYRGWVGGNQDRQTENAESRLKND